jgi:4'-phosphopantetheinyl transferase EntD
MRSALPTALLLGCLPRSTGLAIAPAIRRRRAVLVCTAPLSAGRAVARPFDTAFELQLASGHCVGVHLPPEASSMAVDDLHPRERDVLAAMQPNRQTTFAGGRIAMRRALLLAGADGTALEPVLSDEFGAPDVAGGVMGSISHTKGLAAAFVRQAPLPQPPGVGRPGAPTRAVGVDVESASREVALKLARRVLSAEERDTLGVSAGLAPATDLLLRVSLKEALYKALHQLLRRPIRWHSVQVQPLPEGACRVSVAELQTEVGQRIKAEALWRLHDGYFLSIASATLGVE